MYTLRFCIEHIAFYEHHWVENICSNICSNICFVCLSCTILHHFAPCSTMLLHVAQCCTMLHHVALLMFLVCFVSFSCFSLWVPWDLVGAPPSNSKACRMEHQAGSQVVQKRMINSNYIVHDVNNSNQGKKLLRAVLHVNGYNFISG